MNDSISETELKNVIIKSMVELFKWLAKEISIQLIEIKNDLELKIKEGIIDKKLTNIERNI